MRNWWLILVVVWCWVGMSVVEASGQAVAPNDQTIIHLQPDHYNRLVIDGEAIQAIRGESEQFQADINPVQGDVYLRPRVTTPFTVFVSTQSKHTIQVRCVLDRQQPQTIVLALKPRPHKRSPEPAPTTAPFANAAAAISHYRQHPGAWTVTVLHERSQRLTHTGLWWQPNRRLTYQRVQLTEGHVINAKRRAIPLGAITVDKPALVVPPIAVLPANSRITAWTVHLNKVAAHG